MASEDFLSKTTYTIEASRGTKGQTQCQRLPHEWGLGKGITEAKSYPAEILQRDGFEPRTW
jgi:hypothetical protein